MATTPPSARVAATVLQGSGELAELLDTLRSLPQTDPLLALGLALLVVLLLFAIVALALRRRAKGPQFRRFLEGESAVTVLTHPNPDPDALACAYAVTSLAEDVGTDAQLMYPGQIRHQENRAFRTVLDLDCEQIDSATDLGDDPLVLVDHAEPRGFPGAESVPAAAVIDHHPDGGSRGESFTDIRPTYGACATLFAEYFQELDVAIPDPERGESIGPLTTPLATGLLYGILADTDDLTRGCSNAEFQAAQYLYPAVDEDTLDRIANPQVDAEVLDVKARAIADRDVRAPFAVADVGEVSNADAIPQAADELLRLEGVSAVVVLGHRDGVCQLSGRSRDDRVHMGETLRAALDDLPGGNAGGHARMGGGRVRLNGAPPESLTERLFEAMNGER